MTKPIIPFIIAFIFIGIIMFDDKPTEIEIKFNQDLIRASSESEVGLNEHYVIATQNIIVYTSGRPLYDIEESWQHGKGHLIWFRDFNDTQRQEWELIFNNTTKHKDIYEQFELMRNGSPYFISDYAQTDAIEDFAESFSNWYLKKNVISPLRLEFMETYRKP